MSSMKNDVHKSQTKFSEGGLYVCNITILDCRKPQQTNMSFFIAGGCQFGNRTEKKAEDRYLT